jgi:hypothetical protein
VQNLNYAHLTDLDMIAERSNDFDGPVPSAANQITLKLEL